jgi:glycosyltransferase involved in cell wall biosynthesis
MNNADERALVSVVIPTYDRIEFLPTAIRSVLNQSYEPIELIVIDDCSPESPRRIVEEILEDRLASVVFIEHETNRGASAARNTGIEHASGQLIAFLDDDDWWEGDKIERQVAAFTRADEAVGVVCTGIRSVDSDGSTITVRDVDCNGDVTKDLLCGTQVPLPSIMVRRRVLDHAGEFDEEMNSYEDTEWTVRLSRHCEFRSIPDPLVISLRDDAEHEQLTDDFETKRAESYPRFVEKCRPIAAKYGPLYERKMLAFSRFRLGYAALGSGQYAHARKYFKRAVATWPFEYSFYPYMLVSMLGGTWYKRARIVRRKLVDYQH